MVRKRHDDEAKAPKKRATKKRATKKRATKKRATKKRATKKPSKKSSRLNRACAAAEVEKWDPDEHPVLQASPGTQHWLRLRRPISRASLQRRRGKQLSEDVISDIERVMSEGLCQYHAEDLLGLSARSIENWRQTARKHEAAIEEWDEAAAGFRSKRAAEDALGPRPDATLHMQLDATVRQVEAIGEGTLFGKLVEHALSGDPITLQWLLERRFPSRWGRLAMRGGAPTDEHGKPKRSAVVLLDRMLDALNVGGDG